MKLSIKTLASLTRRRSRRGQSLLIIAFAFIALIAFVGIATDVALLFVRYSTLRRAVDAAAIAAAGQVRESTDYIGLNAVARQFINVHGISPSSVKVETCETEIIDYLRKQGIDPAGGVTSAQYSTAHNNLIDGIDVGGGSMSPSELCKRVPQKLVRVWAQVNSATTFLSVLGFGSVTLQSSSISQTAVLDVALLLDTSVSTALDTYNLMTTYRNYECYPSVNSASATDNDGNFNVSDDRVGNDQYDNYYDECNNADELRTFKPFTDPPNADPKIPGGLALDPFPFDPQDLIGNNTNGKSLQSFQNRYDTFNPGSYEAPTDTDADTSDESDDRLEDDDIYARRILDASAGGETFIDNLLNNNTLNATEAVSIPGVGTKRATTAIRYECWYKPTVSLRAHRSGQYVSGVVSPFDPSTGVDYTKGNYNWGGCCNDPGVQSDASGGVITFAYSDDNLDFNPDPDWYVIDKENWTESKINVNGTKVGSIDPGAELKYGGIGEDGDYKNFKGDGNFSDLICQPFKGIRDAARRFIKRLDFVRGDRVVLVTFGRDAKVIKPITGEDIEIFTNKNNAVINLNMQVGVEASPHNMGDDCHIYKNPSFDPRNSPDWLWQGTGPTVTKYYGHAKPLPSAAADYWVVSQCAGTNLGSAVFQGGNTLVKPELIRRDSVWVMVVLSDGYPNRTPAYFPAATTEVGFEQRNWLSVPSSQEPVTDEARREYCDPTYHEDEKNPTTGKYCDPNIPPEETDPALVELRQVCLDYPDKFQTKPYWCAKAGTSQPNAPITSYPPAYTGWDSWGYNPYVWDYSDATLRRGGSRGVAADFQKSFGFCPEWTFRMSAASNLRQPRQSWIVTDTSKTPPTYDTWKNTEPAQVFCVDGDPDSRHFCMSPTGNINPDRASLAPTDAYACDVHYDPEDYARDRVDFAALKDYTAKTKGNFIAMYSIFFNPKDKVEAPITGTDLAENILGVKMMRYIADAGDNGEINNPVHVWYRAMRDASVNPPPTGGFAYIPAASAEANVPKALWSDNGSNYQPQGSGLSNQPWWPGWSPTNPAWENAPYKYNSKDDPCAEHDIWWYDPAANAGAGADVYISPSDPEYMERVRTDCGQYFYARDITSVNKAFAEISSRLFTRLSR